MRPTAFRRVWNEFRSPWERREAWRYQAPYKAGSTLSYGQHLHHAIGVYAVYWLWREVVQYGPLKPYVYGEDEDPHHHGHDADGGHHPAEDAFEAHPKYDHKSLIQQAEDALRDSPTLQMVNDKIKLADD